MKTNSVQVLLASASIATLASIQPAHGQGEPGAAPAAQAGGQLEEIVVTAQKTEEKLQRVPISITALDSATLETQGVQDVTDLGALVPNVSVAKGFSASGPANPLLTIRGIASSTSAIAAQNSGIAIYLDGVYLSRSVGQAFDLADIQRMEILRGPQGTLYGANAVGGAINIVTRQPSGQFGVKQDFTAGSFGEFRSKTRIDFPEVQGFSAEIIYLHSQIDGYERNLGAGVVWDLNKATYGHMGVETSARDLGSNDVNAIFAAVHYSPPNIDDLSIDYKFDYTDQISVSNGLQLLGLFPAAKAFFPAPYGTCGNCGGGPIILSSSPQTTLNSEFSVPDHIVTWGQSLTVKYSINDWLDATSITAHRSLDLPFTTALGGGNQLFQTTAGRMSEIEFNDSAAGTYQKQWSEEANLHAKTDFVDVTFGIFYFDEGLENILAQLPRVTQNPSLFDRVYSAVNSNLDLGNENLSEYGQATFHVTEQVDLTVGLRESYDDHAVQQILPLPVSSKDTDHRRMNWLAQATYRPTENVMTYGKVSTGYITGGIYQGVPFGQETITTAEVGAKTEWLDQRLRINAAGYWSDFRNYQAVTTNAQLCAPVALCIYNAGAERLYGGELEVTALPVDDLTLRGTVGYTRQSQDGIPLTGAIIANPMPKWDMDFGAEYTLPDFLGGKPSIGADLSYVTQILWGRGGATAPAQFQNAITTPGHFLFNAHATLADLPIGPTTGKITVWGKNIFDKRYFSFILPFPGSFISGNMAPPASVGVDLSLTF
ncbi:MAG TPA: TonB-dependent receptor [Gemmataceae bacterium]|nr:TonB-dependent receptor [Gemmataceae bacterium]